MSDIPPVTKVFALAIELAIAGKMPAANTIEGCTGSRDRHCAGNIR